MKHIMKKKLFVKNFIKYFFNNSHTLLFLLTILLNKNIFCMNFIEYENEKEKIEHVAKIKSLKEKFELKELGIKIFSQENTKYLPDISKNKKHAVLESNLINLDNGKQIGKDFSGYLLYKDNKNYPAKIKQIGNKLYILDHLQPHIFSDDEKFFLTLICNNKKNKSPSCYAKLIQTSNEKEICKLDNLSIKDCEFSKNEKLLFAKFNDDSAQLIDTSNGKNLGDKFYQIRHSKFCFNDEILKIKFMNNTESIINIDNTNNQYTITKIEEYSKVKSIEFSSDKKLENEPYNKFIFVIFDDESAKLINLFKDQNNKTIAKQIGKDFLKTNENSKFSPNGKLIFVTFDTISSDNHSGKLINTNNGKQIGTDFKQVYSVEFSQDSKLLLINFTDSFYYHTIKLINTNDGKQIGPDFSNVSRGQLSPNGKLLFLDIKNKASNNHFARLINTQSGRQICKNIDRVTWSDGHYPNPIFPENTDYILIRVEENENFFKKLLRTNNGECILTMKEIYVTKNNLFIIDNKNTLTILKLFKDKNFKKNILKKINLYKQEDQTNKFRVNRSSIIKKEKIRPCENNFCDTIINFDQNLGNLTEKPLNNIPIKKALNPMTTNCTII